MSKTTGVKLMFSLCWLVSLSVVNKLRPRQLLEKLWMNVQEIYGGGTRSWDKENGLFGGDLLSEFLS